MQGAVRITQYLNTTKEEIEKRKFNIFYGLSLGNKYFTPEHVRAYLEWGLNHTKDKVGVLIPDKLQAVNYEVKSGYSPTRALTVALRKGEEIEKFVNEIVETAGLPAGKIAIYHWADIEDADYLHNLSVIDAAFRENPEFHSSVVQMVKGTSHLKNLELSDAEYERLAKYILDELPLLITGFTKDGITYELLPYPGLIDLDYLALDLQEGTTYPEITRQLRSPQKLRLINAFAE